MYRNLLLALGLFAPLAAQAQWIWEDPLPQGNAILTITAIDSNTVWAAGVGSTLLRRSGTGPWERQEISPDAAYIFRDMEALAADNIWLLGTNFGRSRVYHYDGKAWNLDVQLNSALVEADWLSSTDAWGVGSYGLLQHFNGTAWAPVSSGTTANLNDVHFADATHGWAVGDKGTILYYDGNAWSAQSSPVTESIISVWMTAPDEGWALAYGKNLLHFDGVSWSLSSENWAQQATGLFFLNPDTGWAIGHAGSLWRYQNGLWQAENSTGTQQLEAIWMRDENNGWAAGNYELLQQRAGVWENHSQAVEANLQHVSLDMLDENQGWVVGDSGLVLQKSGSGWQKLPAITPRQLNDVFFINATEGWIVGDAGAILRYTNNAWQQFPSPTTKRLWALHMLSGTDGWAVGDDGLILHYNSAQWTPEPSLTTEDLLHVHFYEPGQGWAVGTNGIILRYLNGAWSIFAQSGDPDYFTFVRQTSATDGWMVGAQNTILRFDGTAWNPVSILPGVPLLPSAAYSSVDCSSPEHCLVGVLNQNFLLEWKNEQWRKIPVPGYLSNRRFEFLNEQTAYLISFYGILRLNLDEVVGAGEPPAQATVMPPLQVFPNPASNQLWLRFLLTEASQVDIRLYSITGALRQIWPREVLDAGEQLREIGLTDCPPGVYCLELRGENWVHRQKVVVH